MKQELLDLLACPGCGGAFELSVAARDGIEVMEGGLDCSRCRTAVPVRRGVPRFTGAFASGHAPTAEAFGWQWKRFSGLDARYRQQFLDWIRPVEPTFFRDRLVLEGGCGKGRHTRLAAEFGARAVVAIDLSEAVDVAFANTRDLPNAHVVQADLNHPPVRPIFDYAFSVGVLHHLPDPERGFRALVSRLRPGGHISAWVYGREGNGWIVHVVSPIRERVTSRMPRPLLSSLATLLTAPVWASTRAVYGPAQRRGFAGRLPYGSYLGYIADFSFTEQRTIVFDHLVAPVAHYIGEHEFADWFARAGLTDVTIAPHNANSWRGFGRVPVEG